MDGWSHHLHIILFVIQREGRHDEVTAAASKKETPFAPKDEKRFSGGQRIE